MKIFVDAMGGDNAPESTVKGSLEALRKYPNIEIVLAGIPEKINPYLTDCDDVKNRITVLDAPDVITNHESPVIAVRTKKESAIVKGMLMLRANEVDAFVSSGSTGAVLAGGIFRLGRVPGVERPCIATMLPTASGHVLLCDSGANVDCKADWLLQFGIMGDAYMKKVAGINEPRVGLLNIGAESEKGNALVKEAYPLIEKSAPFKFTGNAEGRDVTSGDFDVIIADGFCGNLILKFMEGVAGTLMSMMKKEMLADTRSKLGALLAKPAFRRLKKSMDYSEVGGAPLLGLSGTVIKAHGSCNAHAFACAISQAIKMSEGRVAETIEAELKKILPQGQAAEKEG
ncbi:MAG: phosphate acyltransferase PlsX [Eubacteriales bacterium]|nr:phosphate acyltransferase PlsX [Eubacteriales bacterium]MDD3882171.1 phosphate acyltransferase PlsX [Eubacteriales bacterium]MDD4513785.1 phosphate acyltransferase PlsX [Eubacteriales bacterium]